MKRFVEFFIIVSLVLLAIWLFGYQKSDYAKRNDENLFLVKNGAGLAKDIYVPRNPKRVVILSTSSFDMWVNLGGASSIVGVPNFANADQTLYQKIGKDTKILGAYSYKSPEMVLHLKPDLVIMNGFDGVQGFMEECLQRENIPLLSMPCRSVEDTYKEIELFGFLLNNSQQAEKEIARIKKNIQENKEKYTFKNKKTTLLIFGTSTSFSMLTPYTRQGDMLELACGENIVQSSVQFLGAKYVPLSLEYVALKKPDHVFFLNHGKPEVMERKMKETLADNSAWYTIKAVKEGRVHVLPLEYFITNPGLNTDYAVISLSEILYK